MFTIKAFEAGLIFATFFFIPVISAPTPSVDSIDARLKNPCGYREKRHSRSAKEEQVEEQFKLFKYEYYNMTQLKIKELYETDINLDHKESPTPSKVFKNKRKNYKSLQIYAKAFDTLANGDNNVIPTGNFTLEARKNIFDTLSNSTIRLLCVMYDEQKRNIKGHVKDADLTLPDNYTSLYYQDQLVLTSFEKFLKKLDGVIPYPKKNKKKKKNQKVKLNTPERPAKKGNASKNNKKKNTLQKNKRKSLKASS